MRDGLAWVPAGDLKKNSPRRRIDPSIVESCACSTGAQWSTMAEGELDGLGFESNAFETLERDFQEVLTELVGDKSLERFRQEYEKLHRALKKSHDSEKRLIKKCRELNSEIVSNAAKVQTALKLSQEDQNTIASLKREIEKAWKMVDASHEKEARAKETISQLKSEISNLSRLVEQGAGLSMGQENQVNELLKDKDDLTAERDAQVEMIAQLRQEINDYLGAARAKEQASSPRPSPRPRGARLGVEGTANALGAGCHGFARAAPPSDTHAEPVAHAVHRHRIATASPCTLLPRQSSLHMPTPAHTHPANAPRAGAGADHGRSGDPVSQGDHLDPPRRAGPRAAATGTAREGEQGPEAPQWHDRTAAEEPRRAAHAEPGQRGPRRGRARPPEERH